MLIPSVQIYIRRHSTRKYVRIRTRNPQMLGPGDSYCHIWFKGQRKWSFLARRPGTRLDH